MIDLDEISSDSDACISSSEKQCLYFSIKNSDSIYNANKCYEKQIETLKEEKQDKLQEFLYKNQDYIDFLGKIEEANQCSGGICSKNASDYFVFSNINNGRPQTGCHEFISDSIEGNFSTFLYGFVFCLFEVSMVQLVYISLASYRTYKFCCKKKKKNDKGDKMEV